MSRPVDFGSLLLVCCESRLTVQLQPSTQETRIHTIEARGHRRLLDTTSFESIGALSAHGCVRVPYGIHNLVKAGSPMLK